MRNLFVLCWLLLLAGGAHAAVLKGRVTDENGETLPFATLYIRNSTTGTATNEQGFYQLTLAPGTYQVVFQYVGYKTKVETVEIGTTDVERNVTLQLDIFNLKEVTVKANEKDPAYAIVKAAIARRKYHLQEVLAYNCRVYTKGLGKLAKVPNRVLGIKINDLKPGVVYFSETVSELSFRQPAKMHERMISSKVSGSQKDFSFNRASRATFSFYENLLKVPGLSERGFVSPIAANALLYYRYKLMGATQENGLFINKIKVTPIRRNDPAFEGYIYIIDDSWRLHSLDLKLDKAQIEYADTVRIRQSFGPVQDDVWMLFSQKLTTQFDSFGFVGDGYFTTVYSNYKIQPKYPKPTAPAAPTPTSPETPQPKTDSTPQLTLKKRELRKLQKAKADEIFGLQKNKNELMVVEKDANTRDSAYWESIRPIPLTQEEQKDYVVKDSLEVVQQSKPVQDSLDRIRNKFSPNKLMIDGYSYRNSYKKYSFYIPPFLKIYENNAALQYNTVEGVAVNAGFTYRKWMGEEDSRKGFSISPMLRYGFSNGRLGAKITATYAYEPATQSSVTVSGGRFTEQFSSAAPVHTFWNGLYTLLREQNFLKIYQKTYLRLNHGFELANGLNLFPSFEFADRQPLVNTTETTLKDWPNKQFTSNVPVNAELTTTTAFTRHQAFVGTAVLQYRPGLKYITRPNEKWRLGSKYPTLSLGYLQGFAGIFGSDVDYNRLTITVNDRVDLGLAGTSAYSVQVGGHPNNRRMYFMDYRHFNGNLTIYAGGFGGFQLLDYYLYSTNNNYLVANFRHEFNGFIFNKIPVFRKLKLQEVASLNYLRTQKSKNYLEVGVGIEHIFKILRVDFITSSQSKEKTGAGFRVGFGF